MKIQFAPSAPATPHVTVIPVAKGIAVEKIAEASGAQLDLVKRAVDAARFEGETSALVEFYAPAEGGVAHIVLVGTGTGEKDESSRLERAGGAVSAKLAASGAKTIAVDAKALSAEAAARFIFGLTLRAWRYDVYRTKQPAKQKLSLEEVIVVGAPEAASAEWDRLDATLQGVALTRELITEPANIIYPESFVDRVRPLAELGVTVRVIDEKEMASLGMGALLGVAQGSPRPPRIVVMEWKGEGSDQSEPLLLVGKGVTFDSGGISIKPAGGMEDMKWDMGGAGAVAGTMKALALRKAKAHVVGVCGLVENMPDGLAQRPGDVVKTMSGQTVEVINTDAEGRLILCDVLTWVQREYKPKTVIDLATLTGAMIVTLGHEQAGIFSNDDKLADSLLAAAKTSGDLLWRLPMGEAYDKLIDSPIADMKNVGPREGGSITAAQFIRRFIDDGVAWAHLDIAGVVWASKPGALWDRGATGFGVRLLDRYVADNFER